jgi:hypothetical protein
MKVQRTDKQTLMYEHVTTIGELTDPLSLKKPDNIYQ